MFMMEEQTRPYRKAIGGRGREWASECLKLLEALLELDDSKSVKEPVNPLKYPEYYSDVANPIDLSKVMLKFHGGAYQSLESFAYDMRQMFNNYKTFFKDANTEIYTQVHRLSWWFEAEVSRIFDKYSRVTNYTKGHPYREPGEKRGRPPKQMPLYSNESHANSKLLPDLTQLCQPPSVDPYMQPSHYNRYRGRSPLNLSRSAGSSDTLSNQTEKNTNIIVSINHGPCSLTTNEDKLSGKEFYDEARHGRSYSDPSIQHVMSRLKPSTVSQLARGLPGSNTDTAPKSRKRNLTDLVDNNLNLLSPQAKTPSPASSVKPSRMPRLSFNKLMLEISVSNIWFGTARIKPKKPALLSDEGLQIWYTQDDQEMPITILAEEIVRCVAHFSNSSNKHTLFLFILPSCSKRLEALNGRYTHCSMIVVFLNVKDSACLSSLVHIFWNMGQKSMFGSIFSEVDQKGALLLLGNIRPGIVHRVANKYKGISLPSVHSPIHDLNGLLMMDCNESSRKRKCSIDEGQQTHLTATSGSTENSAEDRETVDDNPMSNVARLLSGQNFDKDFAQKLGASLQQGFREGVTEVLKNLAVNMSLKGPATAEKSGDVAVNSTASCNKDGNESDLEIIIPTDSDDEEVQISTSSDQQSTGVPAAGEDDLAVTRETISIRCPITQQIMQQPLKNRICGHCYDQPGVEGLISNRKEKARCPVPGCSNMAALRMTDMEHDFKLWKFIQDKANSDTSRSKTGKN